MRMHTHVTSRDLFDILDTSCSSYYCILQLTVNPKLYLSVVVFVILLKLLCIVGRYDRCKHHNWRRGWQLT